MGWFFRRRDPPRAADSARARLTELTDTIERADPELRRACAAEIATEWRAFIAEYGSPEAFKKLPEYQKMAYFEKRIHLQSMHDETENPASALASALLTTYFAALIHGDRAGVSMASAALAPLLETRPGAHVPVTVR